MSLLSGFNNTVPLIIQPIHFQVVYSLVLMIRIGCLWGYFKPQIRYNKTTTMRGFIRCGFPWITKSYVLYKNYKRKTNFNLGWILKQPLLARGLPWILVFLRNLLNWWKTHCNNKYRICWLSRNYNTCRKIQVKIIT